MPTNSLPQKVLPSPEELCLTAGLYQNFEYDEIETYGNHLPHLGTNYYTEYRPLEKIECFKGTLDFYCPFCLKESTFKTTGKCPAYQPPKKYIEYCFNLKLSCTRNCSYTAYFFFKAHAGVLQKIGQTPSRKELTSPSIKQYKKELGPLYPPLNTAVGLYSHGVGAGSFVYLRRIFESLVEAARQEASTQPNWDEKEFKLKDMKGKLALLKPQLPAILYENPQLYGVLSHGVHNLSEDDCLQYFPAILSIIRSILDKTIARKKEVSEHSEISSDLAKIKTETTDGTKKI